MRFVSRPRREWTGPGESSLAIVAMGLALAIAGIVRTLSVPAAQPIVALELFVSLLVPTGLATGGYWLAARNVRPTVRWRVATRVSIGVVVACGLGVWLTGHVALEGGTIRDPLSLVTTFAAVGGATGFITAVYGTQRGRPADPTLADGKSPADDGDDVENDPTNTAGDDGDSKDHDYEDDATSDDPVSAAATATETGSASIRERSATRDGPRARVGPSISVKRVEFDGTATPTSTPVFESSTDRVASIPTTAETVIEVLRDDRARIALAALYHDGAGDAQTIDDLARVVADHTDESPAVAAVSLRHSTLPRLRAIRAIEWEPYADRVAASKHAVFEEGVRETSVVLESFEPGTR